VDGGDSQPVGNPFRPSFGVNPPLLVGRDAELVMFVDALESGAGAPGRATLYTGLRGVGKTVMLNEVEALAREHGWVVVSETAVNLPFHLGGVTWQPPSAAAAT